VGRVPHTEGLTNNQAFRRVRTLQLDQHGLGEAGADAAGEGQPARGVVYGQDERAERPGPPAAAGFVADDDDFLAVTSRSLRLSPTTWPLST
jgi:hypothetical protein